MSGQLTLTAGQVTSTHDLSADDSILQSTIRNAAVEFGYNAVIDGEVRDAQSDPYPKVQDWVVNYLVRHMKQASDGHRVNKKSQQARQDEQDIIDSEDVVSEPLKRIDK